MKIITSILVIMGMFFLSGCDDKKEMETTKVETQTDGNVTQTKIENKIVEVDSNESNQTDMNMNTSGLATTTTETVTVENNDTNMTIMENNTTDENMTMENNATSSITPTTTEEKTSSVDVKSLFTRCSACHGQNAELKALGKSEIIKDWEKDKIASALHGYKDGTYGGAMKGVMQSQAKTLSDIEIDALSDYISKM